MRIGPAPHRPWNPVVRLSYRESRRRTGTVLPSLRLYARLPSLLTAFGVMDTVLAGLRRDRRRLHALVGLRAAMLVDCPFCIDLQIWESRFTTLSAEEIGAVSQWRQRGSFGELESAGLALAEQMTATPADVDDETFRILRKHLTDTEILALAAVVGWENFRARVAKALHCPPVHLAAAATGGTGSAGGTDAARPAPTRS